MTMSLLHLIFLTLASCTLLRSDRLTDDATTSPLGIESDQLGSRISILKKRINERTEDMKDKSSNQADNLRKEIETQMKKKDGLESRIYTAEVEIKELDLKLGSLQKISDEQRTMIRKIKHDIQSAEEYLIKLKNEASLASKGANPIFGAWFPPWLAALKDTMQFLKPYLTQFSVASKPQFDLLIHALKHYTRGTFEIYERLMKSVMAHHTQVQDTVLVLLKGHEYTKPFADKDIVWYLASAIFALPVILIVNMYTSLVSNKPQKLSHEQHTRRQGKRLRLEN